MTDEIKGFAGVDLGDDESDDVGDLLDSIGDGLTPDLRKQVSLKLLEIEVVVVDTSAPLSELKKTAVDCMTFLVEKFKEVRQ